MGNWFKGAFEQFGVPPPGNVDPQLGRTPRGLDAESRHLLEEALPRGLPFLREQQNRSERAEWASVEEIEGLKYKSGDILLGKFNGQRLGHMDDKPMLTVASARSGKSSTVIVPTRLTYPGSALVLDPKGELATARERIALGEAVGDVDRAGRADEESSGEIANSTLPGRARRARDRHWVVTRLRG
jgi:type IV secretion system protein VirD4